MSDSVKILIEAENKSSAVIAQAAKDVDAKVKSIKQSGEQAKKSTEFFGSIANALGGSEIGAFAGQLAQLTEKTSQFSEVQKLGGAGALAFKAGLVAAVGVIGFQFGQAVGNAIFQTKKWTDELERAKEKSKEFNASLLELKDFNFGRDQEKISLISDPEEQKKATADLLASIEKQVFDKRASIEKMIAEKDKKENANAASGLDIISPAYGIKKAISRNFAGEDELTQQIKDGEEFIKKLNEQVQTLQRSTDETAQGIKLRKEENELKQKSESYLVTLRNELALLESVNAEKAIGNKPTEIQVKAKQGGVFGAEATSEAEKLLKSIEAIKDAKAKTEKSDSFLEGLRNEVSLLRAKKDEVFAIEAGQKTFGAEAGAEAAQLLQEKEMLIAKRDAEKKAEDDKIAKAKQVEEIRQRELDRLEEERVLIEKGKEAAHAFNLEKQGLSKNDAKQIASERSAIDKINDAKKMQGKEVPSLQAKESRLLTRGDGEDPTKQVAANTALAVEELRTLNKSLMNNQKNNVSLRVIGGGI